ncbi:hypothetical protein K7432_005654 [Basidiobolus ranarum]|uniref:Hyaluronan-mediated motility receptor C-terminal domain-containing protein n=1 Tax=Basidiobolus ranarum TaxID=34480 RepID=A0ABR2W2T1_9FUNG
MFSTSKRFNDKVNNTPGPGEYNLNAPNGDKYKKYGFLHKSKRFSDGERDDYGLGEYCDSPGPETPRKPPSRSSSSLSQHPGKSIDEMKYKREVERWKEKYEKQNLIHEKELEHLEEKSRKLEIQYQNAVKEKNNIVGQVAIKESEIQELILKQNHLKLNLEKTERSAQSLMDKGPKTIQLQKRIDDLEKQNIKLRGIADKAEKSKEKSISDQITLKSMITTIKADLEQKGTELLAIQMEMTKVSDKNKKEVDSLMIQKEQLIQMHAKEIQTIQQLLDSTNGELDSLRNLLQQRDQVIEMLEGEKQQTNLLMEQLKSSHAQEIDNLQQTIDTVKQELLEERETLSRLQAEYAQETAKLANDLETSRQETLNKVEEGKKLGMEHTEATKKLQQNLLDAQENFDQEKLTWGSERDSLSRDKSELTEKLNILESAQGELRMLSDQLTQDKVSLELEFQEKRSAYESQITSLNQSLLESRELYEQLDATRTKQNVEFEVQVKALEDKLLEFQSLAETNKSGLLKEIETLNVKVESLSVERDELNSQYTEDLSTKDGHIVSLEEKLESCESKLVQNSASWAEEKEVLQGRINDLESSKQQLDLEITSLRQQMLQEQSRQAEIVSDLEKKLQVEIDGRREDSEAWVQEKLALVQKQQEETGHLQESHDKIVGHLEQEKNQQAITIDQLKSKIEAETDAHVKLGERSVSEREALLVEHTQKLESIRTTHGQEINELQSTVVELQATAQETNQKLAKATESFNEKRKDLERSIHALESDLVAAQSTLVQKTEEYNEHLEVKNNEIQALKMNLQESEAKYTEESKDLQSSIDDLHKQLEEKQAMIASLEGEVTALQNAVQQTTRDIEELRESSKKQIADLSQDMENVNQQFEEYRGSKSAEISELSSIVERVNTELEQQRESSTEKIDALHIEIDRICREHDEYRESKVVEISQLNSTIELINQELSQEKESNSGTVTDLKSSIQDISQEFQQYRESSTHDIAQLKEELEQISEELAQTQDFLESEVEARDQRIQHLMSDLKDQYFQRKELVQQQTVKIQELTAQVANRDLKIHSLESEADSLREELVTHEQQAKSLNDIFEGISLSSASNGTDDVQEMEKLHHEYQSLHGEFSLLRQDFNSAQEDAQVQKEAFESLIHINKQFSAVSQIKDQLESSLALSLLSKMTNEFEEERRLLKEEVEKERAGIIATNEAQARRIKDLEAKVTQINEQSEAQLKSSTQLLDQKLEQTERELHRKEREIESLGRRIEQDMSSWLSERKRLAQIANNAEAEVEKLMLEVDRLRCKANAADNARMEIEEQMQLQSQFLAQKHSMAFDELAKISGQNAKLLGHNNSKQKIKHITQLKEENIVLKKENLSLLKARDQYKIKVMRLERDLEAYQSVTANNGKVIRSRAERASRNGVISPPLDSIEETMSIMASDHGEY